MRDNHFKCKGFLVWSISTLFFLYEFLLRTVIGTFQQNIMHDLSINSFRFSLLSTTLFLAVYGAMQIPVGLIVDNIGLKKSLLIGAVACAFSCIGFSCSHSFVMAIAYRMLMGFGASFGFVCLLITIYDWLPRKYIAIFIGLSQFIGTMGPMIAAGPLDSLSEAAGITWRVVFTYLSGVGFLLSILIFLCVENNQHESGKYIILNKPEKITDSLKKIFSKVQPWYIAFFSANIYFAVEYLSESEGRAFLTLKGISLNSASYMITISWIGYAFACAFLGFVSDFFSRRKTVMVACGFTGLLSILLIIFSHTVTYLQIAFFLLGISAAGQSVAFATIGEQFKEKYVNMGFSLNNAIIITTSAINAPVIGYFLDSLPHSVKSYQIVFSFIAILIFSALIISLFFIKETYCKSVVGFTFLSNTRKLSAAA